MYISHKYKFIFLRTPKTASSSLSDFFIQNIDDPNAIYTGVDERKIKGTMPIDIVKKYERFGRIYHLTLVDLIREKFVTADMLNEYYIFSVIRDPIDRQKSMYYFRKKIESEDTPPSLEEYKRFSRDLRYMKESPLTALPQVSMSKIDDILVGEFWLFEFLQEHIEHFMKVLNLPIRYALPRHKVSNRAQDFDFDEETLTAIKTHFKEDFEQYGILKEQYNENKGIHFKN